MKKFIVVAFSLVNIALARPPVDLVVPQGRAQFESPALRESDVVFTDTPRKREKIIIVKKVVFLHMEPSAEQSTKTRFKKGTRLKYLKASPDKKWASVQSEDGVYEGWVPLNSVVKFVQKK